MEKIFIELSGKLKNALDENGMSLENILRNANIEAAINYEKAPYSSTKESRTKDLVPVILASSALVATIGFTISKILNTLYNEPYFVEYYEYEVLKDNGRIVRNDEGNPIMQLVKKYALIEPRKEHRKDEFEFSINSDHGVVIKFKAEDEELDSLEEAKK